MVTVNPPVRPRRLSRAESQARTRAALIDAAGEVFAERGFHGASVEDIAARAGFTRGAFYSNFSDKDDLFLAVFDAKAQGDVADIAPIVSAAHSIDDIVQGLKELRRVAPNDSRWNTLLAEFRLHALRNPALKPRLAAREQAQRAQYTSAIQHTFTVAGVDPPGDLELLALILQVLDDGVAYHQDIEADAIPQYAFLDALELLTRAALALARSESSTTPGRAR